MDLRRLQAIFLPVTLLVSACSSGGSASPIPPSSPADTATAASSSIRTNEGGEVTVVVDWAGPDGSAVFDVTLDTHSVDLDALDLADAVLRNDRGESLAARPWAAPKGGHHREGALSFDGDAAAFYSGAKWIELVLPDINDVPERTFRWETGA